MSDKSRPDREEEEIKENDRPGNEPPAENETAEAGTEETVESLRAQRDELHDKVLRLAAETENFKKRTERDKAEFIKRANQSLVSDILPVLDNLERALDHSDGDSDDGGVREGLSLIHQDLVKALTRHGLEAVESLGKPFDPEYHEAMMQQEDADVDENTVLTEMQKGYLFQGRLLRPAMVVVSKKPADSPDTGARVDIKVV